MIPCSFDESNRVLSRPEHMTDEQCGPLCVASGLSGDQPVVVSCWKLTQEELEEFRRTGRIWLITVGQTMPPVILTAIKPFSATS